MNPLYRKFLILLALVAVGLLAACQRKETAGISPAPPAKAQQTPSANRASLDRDLSNAGLQIPSGTLAATDFTLPSLDGRSISLSSLRGKVVFLNFWATWCPPCRAEMPSMEKLFQRYKNRGLEMLAVDLQEDKAKVASYLKDNSFTFTALLDSTGAVGATYGAQAIPTTYLVDGNGDIIARAVGGIEWDSEAMFSIFDRILEP